MRASIGYETSSKIERYIAWALALAVALPLTVVALPQSADAQCTHGVAIFKSCQGPRRSCATDADCPDTECTDGVCNLNLDNVTDCSLTLSHADTCGDTTKITEAFDKQDFGGDNVRVPAIGNLPIQFASGNAVCCAGPVLPCFVGPAGSVAGIAAGETGCGALALPGAGTAGSVTFRQNTYVVQPNDPDPLPDQANITVKDLCNVFPAGCSSGLSTVQFTAATDILDNDGCFSTPKSSSTPCTDTDQNVCTIAGCDGQGSCDQAHITPDSTPCPGTPTQCASPGCDGAGNCDPLHVPVPSSVPCTDTDQNVCTIAGCDGLGACDQQHVLPDSTPCPDTGNPCATAGCNGAGSCDQQHVPAPPSIPCADTDQNVCTIAGCDGLGACDQMHITPDSTPCPDTGNECAAAGCNGAGSCDQQHVPVQGSTPCADTDQNVCTVAGCDGLGACDQQHITPDSTPCPDTGNECAAAGCNGAGSCDQQHVLVPDSTPCTNTDQDVCTIAGCDGLGSCDQQHISIPDCGGGDHYKCYKSKADFQQRTVSLVDQFGPTTATVLRPDRFCNPVNKNNEGITDPDAHLNCYKIREPRGPTRDVVVTNQFGELRLTTTRTHTLCVPAVKDQIGDLGDLDINHFKCYRVRRTFGAPKFTERDVQLNDQFEMKATTVIRPFLLCNPVNKNNEGVPDPTNHIICYKIKDVDGQPPFVPVQPNVTDQFVEQDLQTTRRTECGKTRLLCVPSSKRIASPSGAFLDGGAGALLE